MVTKEIISTLLHSLETFVKIQNEREINVQYFNGYLYMIRIHDRKLFHWERVLLHTSHWRICRGGGGMPGTRPPYGTQFFRFCIHFHQKVPMSEVHSPLTGARPPWEILDPPLHHGRSIMFSWNESNNYTMLKFTEGFQYERGIIPVA